MWKEGGLKVGLAILGQGEEVSEKWSRGHKLNIISW